MPLPSPFFDRETGAYDFDRLLAEAVPIAKLVVLVGAVALVPLALLFALGPGTPLAILLTAFAQFVLVVGAALVLLHVVYRALALASRDLE